MRYMALATDYDGTLASDGVVPEAVVDGLLRLRETGRKLILVTGRELEDLRSACQCIDLFDRVVAENGGVLYCPETREERVLTEPPSQKLVELLRERNVTPLSVGSSIVATWHPYEGEVLDAIATLGLEHQVIFNKGAVMVLPSGVNKATGLEAALSELALSPHNVVGVGDAENDHAFLSACECSVAVANALPALKDRADLVMDHDHGEGVLDLVELMIDEDLAEETAHLERHMIILGTREDGTEERIPPYGLNILITGTSGSGKSTVTTGLLERLSEGKYQSCLIDPEGDYENLPCLVTLGDTSRRPTVHEAIDLLENPDQSVAVNLLAVPIDDRPEFFTSLFSRLEELRSKTARPHWIALDEAHHLLPSTRAAGAAAPPEGLNNMLLVTVHPEQTSASVLQRIQLVLTIGDSPKETLCAFAREVGLEEPSAPSSPLQSGDALVWYPQSGDDPVLIRTVPTEAEGQRHRRKYAAGELAPEKSFYFRGPEDKLNLRAHNLMIFVQMAEGVDEETWLHHLRHGDYSKWFREMIGDDGLAGRAEEVEKQQGISAEESRSRIAAAIREDYTAPE